MANDNYPYGNETPVTAGVNAVLAAYDGETVDYPYGNETPVTAGFNAVIAAIKDGGGGGEDGFSPIVDVTTIPGGHEVSIIDATHTEAFDVMDGQDGDDGFSPIVSTSAITGGTQVSITDGTHTEAFDVMDGQDGQDGQDYVLTAQDKADIAALVEADYSNGDATSY